MNKGEPTEKPKAVESDRDEIQLQRIWFCNKRRIAKEKENYAKHYAREFFSLSFIKLFFLMFVHPEGEQTSSRVT